jgi:hypothetical protein
LKLIEILIVLYLLMGRTKVGSLMNTCVTWWGSKKKTCVNWRTGMLHMLYRGAILSLSILILLTCSALVMLSLFDVHLLMYKASMASIVPHKLPPSYCWHRRHCYCPLYFWQAPFGWRTHRILLSIGYSCYTIDIACHGTG